MEEIEAELKDNKKVHEHSIAQFLNVVQNDLAQIELLEVSVGFSSQPFGIEISHSESGKAKMATVKYTLTELQYIASEILGCFTHVPLSIIYHIVKLKTTGI